MVNYLKALHKYIFPIIIIGLITGFIIYAYVKKEGYADFCTCPQGSQLRNGGCLTCPSGYRLSTDYYNAHCVSENPNDYNGKKYIVGPITKKLEC